MVEWAGPPCVNTKISAKTFKDQINCIMDTGIKMLFIRGRIINLNLCRELAPSIDAAS